MKEAKKHECEICGVSYESIIRATNCEHKCRKCKGGCKGEVYFDLAGDNYEFKVQKICEDCDKVIKEVFIDDADKDMLEKLFNFLEQEDNQCHTQ